MQIQFTQDEALLKAFYQTMFPLLPICKNRKKAVLLPLAAAAIVCFIAWFLTRFVLFLIGFVLFLIMTIVNLSGRSNDRLVSKILRFNEQQYGTNAFRVTMTCEDEEIVGTSEQLHSDFFIPYAEITDVAVNREIYCIEMKHNAYFFPISAIPEGEQALTAWLTRKNPQIQVIRL